jgi:hypothetical protein
MKYRANLLERQSGCRVAGWCTTDRTSAIKVQCLSWIGVCGSRLASWDDELVRCALEWTLRLDRAAAQDSGYLAFAEALGQCDLWTADRGLVRAVDRPWVRGAGAPG